MKTSINIKNTMTMISEMRNDAIFQILEYDDLEGSYDINLSIQIDFMKRSKVKLRQARLILEDSAVRIESGKLSYMKGNIEIDTRTEGLIGLGKKLFASKVTGESTFKPILKGTGEVFLEPTFGYFTLIELEDEEIIVDDKMFYACEDTVNVRVFTQKNPSAILFGEEGVFQTKLSGSGIVILEIPIPEKEILRCKMYKDTLKIDGELAILRSGNIEYTVEKSGTTLLGTALNGEGLLNVYRGTGEVWIAPTKDVYDSLKERGIKDLFINEKEEE